MQLFDIEADPTVNYLPYEGTVHYYGKVLSSLEADHYFEMLMKNIAWENDQAIIFGRKIITKRKVAWYGDRGFEYTYSNINKYALPWTMELIELKVDSIGFEPKELLNDSPIEPEYSTLNTAKAAPSESSAITYSRYFAQLSFFFSALAITRASTES